MGNLCYINPSGKYIEIYFNMKIPFISNFNSIFITVFHVLRRI